MASTKGRKQSNLQCFLDRTTPYVVSQSIPKASARDCLWQPIGKDSVECFTLGDLWDQYFEWSAYGLGVPVELPNGETVVQYYVPYLSAIQIYTSKSLAGLRTVGEESESDSWSDDSESEKMSKSWDAASGDSGFEPYGAFPPREGIGHLYCQYIEYSPPYGRIPLLDKVLQLAQSYPGLISFKSVELSPASWMSVSWYPIYHIPSRTNVKDLSASFLTYHTISSSFQDNVPEDLEEGIDSEEGIQCSAAEKTGGRFKEPINRTALPPFGLATYKVHGNFWINSETADQERFIALYSAADSWLKQLTVQHHDFIFFSNHSSM